MNKAQLKLSAEAYAAFANDKPIQVQNATTGAWEDVDDITRIDRYPHRPKPTARRWNCGEDVPAFCWLRRKGQSGWFGMVVGVFAFGIRIIGGRLEEISFDDLDDWEWSATRTEWFPCEVQE